MTLILSAYLQTVDRAAELKMCVKHQNDGICSESELALSAEHVNTDGEISFCIDECRQTAAVQHKLIGFADIDLEVTVTAPCNEAVYQSVLCTVK